MILDSLLRPTLPVPVPVLSKPGKEVIRSEPPTLGLQASRDYLGVPVPYCGNSTTVVSSVVLSR